MSTQGVPTDISFKNFEDKDQEKDDEEDVKTRTEVHGILGGYVSTKANNDPKLDQESSSILTECTKVENASDASKLVGRELASIADQIEEKLGDRFSGILERLGTPDLAFRSFQRIAVGLFTRDSPNGEGKYIQNDQKLDQCVLHRSCCHMEQNINSDGILLSVVSAFCDTL